ncbi:ASCH domain-containing protein [Xylanibacillus composti]|nr:ASCH domain-containing protein [Xylanibacillus composti]
MKAITVWQPWATLIALRLKRLETRGWATSYRGSLAIHAAKYIDREACEREPIKSALAEHAYAAENLPTGAVVALASLSGCYRIYNTVDNGVHIVRCPNDEYEFDKVHYIGRKEEVFGDYTEGRYAWELTDVRKLDEPIPAKGKQRIWNWEGGTYEAANS